MSFGMAIRVEDGIHVGHVLNRVLQELGMSHREAAQACGIHESKFSEGIDGERPLDLWRLRLLPLRFWQTFLPALASALIQQWMVDRCRPYKMLKCELKEDKKEKVS